MADPGTLSGELQGKLGLEASENSIFQKLTSKIGPNSNFATFTKKSKIWNCHKNWLVIGMKLKFSGNGYLTDSNKWWKFQRNGRTFIDSLRWPWMEWPYSLCSIFFLPITDWGEQRLICATHDNFADTSDLSEWGFWHIVLLKNMSHIEVQAIQFSVALKKIWCIQQTHINLTLQKMFWWSSTDSFLSGK